MYFIFSQRWILRMDHVVTMFSHVWFREAIAHAQLYKSDTRARW